MKLKTKQIVIRVVSIILALISLITAYAFASGIVEYEPMQIEGVPTIPLNLQIILLCGLGIINIINLMFCNKIVKYKVILIVLNIIQLLFGGIAHIIGSIAMLVLLFIGTTDVQEEKKPLELPKLEKLQANRKWVYLLVWLVIFLLIYVNIIPIPFLQNLSPSAIMLIIYAAQAVIFILFLKEDIKRDFIAFKGNFKTYMRYILPKIGIFFVVYIIVNIPILLITGKEATNQTQIKELPMAVTASMSILLAPIIEELMFRGMLRKGINNDKLFIAMSSILFGAVHVLYVEENPIMYLYLIPYALIGYFLARTYTKTNNIFTNISIHFLWNTFCMILLLITQFISS